MIIVAFKYLLPYLKHIIMKLFNELEFEAFMQIAINKAIEKVNESDILHSDLKYEGEKIIKSLTFTVPKIERDKITSSLEMEDKNGIAYADNHVNLKNNDVFATATYRAPFVGNEEIFKIKPLDYQQNVYQNTEFDIEKDYLKFKIRTDCNSLDVSEEWKENLIRSSSEIINFIETNLQQLTFDFTEFKNEMIGPVIHSLKKHKEDLLTARTVAKEVNSFNDNSNA